MEREATNWANVREEYIAGNMSLRELADRHGLKQWEVQRYSSEEGWSAQRRAARARGERPPAQDTGARAGAPGGEGPKDGAQEGAGDAAADDVSNDVQIARRARRALLMMLQRAAEAIPCDATEVKSTGDAGEAKLLKLRDLTAAYKELVDDLPSEDKGGESRVIIDI